MQLKHIKQELCATCGANPVSEHRDRQHTNGQWNEERKFSCGAIIQHNPNSSQTFLARNCPKHEDEVRKAEARNMAKAYLQNSVIPKLECDEPFKERLLYAMTNVYTN